MIDLPLIPLSEDEIKSFPFKIGDIVVISSSDIFFEGLRGQEAIVTAIGRETFSMFKVTRVVAPNHMVPDYPADFEWEIVYELLRNKNE